MWWALPQLIQICLDAPSNVAVAGVVFQIITNLASYFLHPELSKIDFSDITKARIVVVGIIGFLGLLSIIVGGVNVSQVENLPVNTVINGTIILNNATTERATPYLEAMVESGLTSMYFCTAYMGGLEPEMFMSMFAAAQLMTSSFSISLRRGDVVLSQDLWDLIRQVSIAAGSFHFFVSISVLVISGLWISRKQEKEAQGAQALADENSVDRAKNWISGALYLSAGLGLTGAILIWIMQKFPQYSWVAFCLLLCMLLAIPAYIMFSSPPYLIIFGLFLSGLGPLSYGMRFVNREITAGSVLLIIPAFLIWISFPFQYDHEVDNRLKISAFASAGVAIVGCIVAGIGSVDTPYFADEISARAGLTALFFVAGVLGQNKEFCIVPFALGSLLVHSFGGAYALNSHTGQAGSIITWIATFGMIYVFYRKLVATGALASDIVTEAAPILRSDFPAAVSSVPQEPSIPIDSSVEENVTL
eukprot:TRINITY_DN2503_c0_g1_i1.p1 TRINITY_DN2503_c0_g1~~TRINITY_DN2503_c0_g1_i1.p1  ORF type:complete len:475 (-),score=67.30 TRINITY_DN2503_c0_g1_i1:11-1435(-)